MITFLSVLMSFFMIVTVETTGWKIFWLVLFLFDTYILAKKMTE